MPTIVSHPAILMALHPFYKNRFSRSIWFTAGICSIFSDIDVIGFQLGIGYGDLLGHRGLTHSIFFAAILSAVVTVSFYTKRKSSWSTIFVFFFLCTASHGILDAFTDGGLGIAFFSPFSNTRYFFPWRPLEVSPIGIAGFLSGPALSVLVSEIKFLWIPCILVFVIGRGFNGRIQNSN